MPEKATIRTARRNARSGRSASTQAGEFVRGGVLPETTRYVSGVYRGQRGAQDGAAELSPGRTLRSHTNLGWATAFAIPALSAYG